MLDHRLATYGTLGPGRPNHHQVEMLGGSWLRGAVRGRLVDKGWGAKLGFPALELDPAGGEIAVDLLESPDLPAHWARLDRFEGDGYRRVRVDVEASGETLAAWIYVSA